MDAAIGAAPPPATPRPAVSAPARVEPAPPAPQANADRSAGRDSGSSSRAPDTRREVRLDGPTGSLVYRVIDVADGTVTSQTPSEARLSLRAYIDGVIGGHDEEPLVERVA